MHHSREWYKKKKSILEEEHASKNCEGEMMESKGSKLAEGKVSRGKLKQQRPEEKDYIKESNREGNTRYRLAHAHCCPHTTSTVCQAWCWKTSR